MKETFLLFLYFGFVYSFFLFLLYFNIYVITVVPNFPPSSLSTQCPPFPQVVCTPFIVHVHGSCIYVLWLLYSLCCSLHPHHYSVTANLYILTPSCFAPITPTPLPSGNHQNVFCGYDSVFVLLVNFVF